MAETMIQNESAAGPRLGLTPAQLAWRRTKITATDVPKILGLSKWGGPADVLRSKTMDMIESDVGEAAEFGLLAEEPLIRWQEQLYAAMGLTFTIRRNQQRAAPNGIMGATLDAAVYFDGDTTDPKESIEAKTAGIFNPVYDFEEWGEDDTDAIPEVYWTQAVAQLICVPSVQIVRVPALLGGGNGPKRYLLRRESPNVKEALPQIEQHILAWHRKHIERREPLPENSPPPMTETLKRIRRQTGKTISVPDVLVNRVLGARKNCKVMDAAKELAERELKDALSDAEIGLCSLGKVLYKERPRAAYSVEAGTTRPLILPKVKGEGEGGEA